MIWKLRPDRAAIVPKPKTPNQPARILRGRCHTYSPITPNNLAVSSQNNSAGNNGASQVGDPDSPPNPLFQLGRQLDHRLSVSSAVATGQDGYSGIQTGLPQKTPLSTQRWSCAGERGDVQRGAHVGQQPSPGPTFAYQATVAGPPALSTVAAVASCGQSGPKAVHIWHWAVPSRQCKPSGWQPGKLSRLQFSGSGRSFDGLLRKTGSRRRATTDLTTILTTTRMNKGEPRRHVATHRQSPGYASHY